MKKEYKELFDSLHLSAEADARIRQTLIQRGASSQEVIDMKKKIHPIRTLLIAAVLLALLTAAAAAVSMTVFPLSGGKSEDAADVIDSAFGDGIAGQQAYTVDLSTADGSIAKVEHYPAIERVAVDAEKAAELIGSYVYSADEPLTLGDYTLTISGYMLDENGIGVVSIDIDSADTLEMIPGYVYFDFFSGNSSAIDADGLIDFAHYLDSRSYEDESVRTDTHTRLVCYITPFDCSDDVGELILWFHPPEIEDGYAVRDDEQSWYITLNATELISARSFSSDSMQAWVSPLGMTLSGSRSESQNELSIHYADGEVYTVVGDSLDNKAVSSICSNCSDHSFIAFNRLVDAPNIEYIELDGMRLEPEA